MVEVRHLGHAPVIEAVIDFRVQISDAVTVADLEILVGRKTFGYEKLAPIVRSSFGVSINPQEHPAATMQAPPMSETIGVRCHSPDKKYVALLSIEGFTLSRLEPYESWPMLIDEAKRIWAEYARCMSPIRIKRVATRFVNNLRLPLERREPFENYLKVLPVWPSELPQVASRFVQNYFLHDDATDATVVFTQALESLPEGGPVPVILDIDVFIEREFSADRSDAWEFLEKLREVKNRMFFGALTEKAMGLYA